MLNSAETSFHAYHFVPSHNIILLHASHSCILVTKLSEVEPVEPTESVEPEPVVQFVVESKANQGKQLSMIPCSYLIELASCRWAGSGVRPLLPRWSKCGGGVGRCGCDGVLEQVTIILVCFYHNRTLWEHVNIINSKFLFNMAFVSPMLVMEVVWTLLYRTCIELW